MESSTANGVVLRGIVQETIRRYNEHGRTQGIELKVRFVPSIANQWLIEPTDQRDPFRRRPMQPSCLPSPARPTI